MGVKWITAGAGRVLTLFQAAVSFGCDITNKKLCDLGFMGVSASGGSHSPGSDAVCGTGLSASVAGAVAQVTLV